ETRTLVFPDPAGAMIRAGPTSWVTASIWSGARSADGTALSGTKDMRPSSTDSWWMIASDTDRGWRGPPSIHTGAPSERTSAGPPGVTPDNAAALVDHHHFSSPKRAS